MTGVVPPAAGAGGEGRARIPARWLASPGAAVAVAVAIAGMCLTITVVTLAARPADRVAALYAITLGVLLMLGAAAWGAAASARRAASQVRAASATTERAREAARAAAEHARREARQVEDLRTLVLRCHAEVQQQAAALMRGDPPAPVDALPRLPLGDSLSALAEDFTLFRTSALLSLSLTARRRQPDRDAIVFGNLAKRIQRLVQRAIETLDGLEETVDDPDQLQGLFTIDHQVNQLRRLAEGLGVLGGVFPRRRWDRPVRLQEALRGAVTEVEAYTRVTLERVEGALQRGPVAAVVIHIVAELCENATRFSRSQVVLRAMPATGGIMVEVRDEGLGMKLEDLSQVNALLADHRHASVEELMADGRIGLPVAARLAARYGIQVRLGLNEPKGIVATVFIPGSLLEEPGDRALQPAGRAGTPPPAAGVPVLPVTRAPRVVAPVAGAVAPRLQVPAPSAADVQGPGRRPELPVRRAGATLPDEFRDAPGSGPGQEGADGVAPGPRADLMARFSGGYRQAGPGADDRPG